MPTANNKVKVGFLCDISYNSGLGHIKRSLILSEALENSACDCFFFAHFRHVKEQKKVSQHKMEHNRSIQYLLNLFFQVLKLSDLG